MKNLHHYLLLATAAMRTELTPEERKLLNRFLRGDTEESK